MEHRQEFIEVIILYFAGISTAFVLTDGHAKKSDGFSNIFPFESHPQKEPLYFNVFLPADNAAKINALQPQALLASAENRGVSYPMDVYDPEFSKSANLTNSKSTATVERPALRKALGGRGGRRKSPKQRRNPSLGRPYPASLRKRGLADTGLLEGFRAEDLFGTREQDKAGVFISPVVGPNLIDQDQTSGFYTYTFVGESFQLNGSAKITYDVDKIRIIFKFTITGNGNATAHLVTPEQEVRFPTLEDNDMNSVFPRPDSCHPQASENVTTKGNPCQATTENTARDSALLPFPLNRNRLNTGTGRRPLIGPGRDPMYPFLGDQYSFLTSSLMSPYGPSMSESFIFPRDTYFPPVGGILPTLKNYDDIANKDCDVTVTTFIKKWLCIGRTEPPCFMMIMQGSKYKVAKKICPRRVYPKKLLR